MVTLQRHNINAFYQAILVPNLADKFVQRIVAAVRLGFQYIWIDSLCIIQDDKDHWDIYASSVLNFAATSAKDGAGSCYFARSAANIKDLSPIKLRVPSRSAGRSTYLCATAVPWQAEGIKSPLLSRGWVVQERALSRRILHFGRTQFHWECSELAGCEAFPDGLPELGDLITRNPKGDPGKFLGTAEGWDTIANAYCEKSLTYVKDSLTALSALARRHHELSGDQYVAGLWRTELEQQLLWIVTH